MKTVALIPLHNRALCDMKIESGIEIEGVVTGSGAAAEDGMSVTVRWIGTLNRGDQFGEGTSTFRVGRREVIAGLERGVVGMRVGGRRKLRISPHLAYGGQSVADIPANAVLNFDVELLAVSD